MGTLTERRLSESDGGRPIAIDTTGSPGTLLHVATDQDNSYDKIRLYVGNADGAEHVLYMQWGGTDPSDLLPVTIPSGVGLVLTIPLLLLEGRDPPLELRAYADAAPALNVTGIVLRAAALGEVAFQDRTSA